MFVLKVDIAVSTRALISVLVFSEIVELYFTVVVSSNRSVIGSTITGVTEATLNALRLLIMEFLVVVVSVVPVFGLIDM